MHSIEGAEINTDFEHRHAWKQHFETFLGTDPEKHWLFRGRRFKPWFSKKWGSPGLFNPFVAVMLSRGGGLLSLYVLHLLLQKPRYGNDIMREIEIRTQKRWGSNPGAIYPLLTELEDRGMVVGSWEDPDKRTRRVYSITSEGRKELTRLKEVMRPKLEEAISVLRGLSDDLRIDEE
jgi:DNA-binding PadR family transcriptional regulator